tara:strand:- start:480 stop:1019 length:540 start_codon:yes stop_codon:yes gene_type:complete
MSSELGTLFDSVKEIDSSTYFIAATGARTVSEIASIQSQRAALARENYRVETEKRLARLKAIEAENDRRDVALAELAQNKAFQSTAGYYDDGMSFLNINKQVENKMNKDVANIRLMGNAVDNKFRSMLFENTMKEKDLVFGGYTSIAIGLTNGMALYKYNKEGNKQPNINLTDYLPKVS